jgi:hypothetical protein
MVWIRSPKARPVPQTGPALEARRFRKLALPPNRPAVEAAGCPAYFLVSGTVSIVVLVIFCKLAMISLISLML